MATIQVGEFMTSEVITVPTTMPVEEVARVLRERQITGLPVLDERDRVVGVVSDIDIVSRRGAVASDIMSPEVISVTTETDAEAVVAIMANRRIRRVPVLAEGQLVGIVSRTDLVRLFQVTRWACDRCGYFERGFTRPTVCSACSSTDITLQRENQGS
jgi:CBS-domain-containing membrane protein